MAKRRGSAARRLMPTRCRCRSGHRRRRRPAGTCASAAVRVGCRCVSFPAAASRSSCRPASAFPPSSASSRGTVTGPSVAPANSRCSCRMRPSGRPGRIELALTRAAHGRSSTSRRDGRRCATPTTACCRVRAAGPLPTLASARRCCAGWMRWRAQSCGSRLDALSREIAHRLLAAAAAPAAHALGQLLDAAGTISLNVCLMFQRPDVVRYLMVHELCHRRHMNHSRALLAARRVVRAAVARARRGTAQGLAQRAGLGVPGLSPALRSAAARCVR